MRTGADKLIEGAIITAGIVVAIYVAGLGAWVIYDWEDILKTMVGLTEFMI